MLSMELTGLPERHARIIRHYFGFYQEHRACLNAGHWRFGFSSGRLVWTYAENEDETILFVRDGNALEEALVRCGRTANVEVLNLDSRPLKQRPWREVYAPSGERQSGAIPSGGRGRL